MPLSNFHPIIANWFRDRVGSPTAVQSQSWPATVSEKHTRIMTPSGYGKTLDAFLLCIDTLFIQNLASALEDPHRFYMFRLSKP